MANKTEPPASLSMGRAYLSMSLGCIAFILHIACITRWTVIYYTYGNQKGIPVDPSDAYQFYMFLLILSLQPLLFSIISKHLRLFLVLTTFLNFVAFGCTGWLLRAGIVVLMR